MAKRVSFLNKTTVIKISAIKKTVGGRKGARDILKFKFKRVCLAITFIN